MSVFIPMSALTLHMSVLSRVVRVVPCRLQCIHVFVVSSIANADGGFPDVRGKAAYPT